MQRNEFLRRSTDAIESGYPITRRVNHEGAAFDRGDQSPMPRRSWRWSWLGQQNRLGRAITARFWLTARRIRVRRSGTHVTGKGLTEGATKNHDARTVPVPKFLAQVLETDMGERGDTEMSFPARRGGYPSVN